LKKINAAQNFYIVTKTMQANNAAIQQNYQKTKPHKIKLYSFDNNK